MVDLLILLDYMSLILLLFSISLFTVVPVVSQPNYIFILSDDHGSGAVGWRNSQIKTPNIDSLANTGVKLEEFYAYHYCSPTRYIYQLIHRFKYMSELLF